MCTLSTKISALSRVPATVKVILHPCLVFEVLELREYRRQKNL